MLNATRIAALCAAGAIAATLSAIPAQAAPEEKCSDKMWNASNYKQEHCIALLQDYVKHGWGYYRDEVDGKWNINTSAGIASWQKRFGNDLAAESGWVGVKTNRMLCSRGITDLAQLIKNGTAPTGLSELGLDAMKEYCGQPI